HKGGAADALRPRSRPDPVGVVQRDAGDARAATAAAQPGHASARRPRRPRAADQNFVHGATTGADAVVGIYYLDATHPYLATYGDGRPDDNLLAMPQHPPT